MINETLVGVYEGEGIIRLHERPPQLQKDQELLVAITPISREQVVDAARPSPRVLFGQIISQLRHYEQKYGMRSEEFYQRFQSGTVQEEHFDYFDWRVLYDGYRHMQKRFGFSPRDLPVSAM